MNFDKNQHSVFLLHYHLIMCIKYRNKVIDDPISLRLKEMFEYIAPKYHITLEEWNHDIDHVHVLFRGHPNTEISKFINAYKSASSRIIKKEFPHIRVKYRNKVINDPISLRLKRGFLMFASLFGKKCSGLRVTA